MLRIRDVYPGSRILIFTHPGFRIQDLRSRIQIQQQKKGGKKIVIIPFLAVLRIRDVYPGSRILIFTHPGSRIPDLGSRISDLGSKNSNKKRGEKKLVVIPFYVATNFTKL